MENKPHCLAIVGTTATGKTQLALKLAIDLIDSGQQSGVDLISVDSRQVYKGLEVLTGADIPKGWQHSTNPALPNPFFIHPNKKIALHGISIRELTDDWSLGQFVQFARRIMLWSWSNSRLPILVGGTGLYHRHLFSDDTTPQIPQNSIIRHKAENMLVEDIQLWLAEIDPGRLDQMNESDRENPRRLIRAIEVETWLKQHKVSSTVGFKPSDSDVVWCQVENQVELLSAPLELIKKRIIQRVEKRFASGAIQEVENLLKHKLPASAPVLTTLGVPEIRSFLNGEISAENCQKLWALHEFQYAKRQLTWWKKIYKREKKSSLGEIKKTTQLCC